MSRARLFNIFPIPLFLCLFLLAFGGQANAQTVNRDSIAQARQRTLDSARAARQQILDSTRQARQHTLDSIKAERQKITDSLTALRKYRESKRYKDSVEHVRSERIRVMREAQQARVDSMRAAQKAITDSTIVARRRITDSTIAARKAFTDSLTAARKVYNDSLNAVRKARADSLAAITKYRNSKRYKDSVIIVRRQFTDSIKAARQAFADSMRAERKRITDSTIAVRKAFTDSLTAARKAFNDSLAAIRKARTDSLTAAREKREGLKKAEQKRKLDLDQLALELKFQKKREAWSNKQMLKKRWGFPRSVIQNTFTRYNYYFNANRKMEEAQANMRRLAKDDYEQPIPLYSFNPDRDSATLKPDMDSIIQHASLGIQIHDPRTKWGDDLYLLMGQAYYYMGNYEQAIASFQYIVGSRQQEKKAKAKKQNKPQKRGVETNKLVDKTATGFSGFLAHDPANNDALLWLVRTYTQTGNFELSESILDLLQSEPQLPEEMKRRMAEQYAFLALRKNNANTATEQLTLVSADKSAGATLRTRAAFLNGQLLQQAGHPSEAVPQYQTVIDLHPNLEMNFYARRNIAYALLETGEDPEEALSSMKAITRDNKYAGYHSQAYYIMGQVSAANGQPEKAVTYLEKSVNNPRASRQQKAISFAALGNAYYTRQQFTQAQHAYDSAAAFASAAKGDTLVAKAVKRGASLKQITQPLTVIQEQDSLLALAQLSDKEQLSAVRKLIRSLEKQYDDSVFRAENPTGGALATGSTPTGPAALSWYFSNPTMVQNGQMEFKRKWGTRPLTDNWRRAAAVRGSMPAPASNTTPVAATPDAESSIVLDERGIPTEASLLALIPNTPQQKDNANIQLQRAYVDLGKAYINVLDDYAQGRRTLDTLDQRFPAHPHKPETIYLRYQMAMRQDQLPEARAFANQLLQQYGSSQWAALVRPDDSKDGAAGGVADVSAADYYEETYALLQNRSYGQVVAHADLAQARYNDPAYNNKFRIAKASAQAGLGQYDAADTLLKSFVKENPNDSLRPWAEQVLFFIQKRKAEMPPPPPAPAAAVDSALIPATVTDTTTTLPDTAGTAAPAPPATYTYKAATPHYFAFSFNEMASKTMGVKSGLNDFNTLKFSGQPLETTLFMLDGKKGLLLVGPFNNAAQSKVYFNTFKSTPELTREFSAGEYQTFIISSENLNKLRADKNLPAYMSFYKNKYK